MAPKYWAQIFQNKVGKTSYTSLEVDFLDNVVTLQKNFKKKYLTQAPTIMEGLQLHSSTQ